MDDLNSIFIRQINEKQEKAFHELFLRFFNYLVVYCHEASTATGCGGGYCAGGFRECVGGR